MKKYFLLLYILFISGVTYAQKPLSLEEAIKLGLMNNYDILIQQKNIDIADNNNSWGEAGRYPGVNINLNQNNNITDNVKTASPFQLQGQTISNSLNPQLLVNWKLFDGFNVNINKYKLETLENESRQNAEIVVANTVQAIILGYFRTVFEKQRLNDFQKQLTLSKDRLDYINIKRELGSAIITDQLLLETNYLTDSVNFINQSLNYKNAVRDLNFLMGEKEVNNDYIFLDSLNIEIKEYDFHTLQENLENKNIDLRRQYLSQQILNYEVGIARSGRYPEVNLNLGYSSFRSRNDLSNTSLPKDGSAGIDPNIPITAITDNYFANFSVSFTLFNGNRINRAIENAMVREDIGNINIEKLKHSISLDLAKAVENYNVRKQVYFINMKKEEVARQNLEISEDKFKNGTINSFDYRTVQNNYLTAAIQKAQALYNLIDADVTISRLNGDLLNITK